MNNKPLADAIQEWPECEAFYNLMQDYRHAPPSDQRRTCATYEAVKAHLRAAQADDTQRLDKLEALTVGGVDLSICRPGYHGAGADNWLLTLEHTSQPKFSEHEGPTLRASIDAASPINALHDTED